MLLFRSLATSHSTVIAVVIAVVDGHNNRVCTVVLIPMAQSECIVDVQAKWCDLAAPLPCVPVHGPETICWCGSASVGINLTMA